MKKISFFCLAILFYNSARAQIFNQDFTSSAVLADYFQHPQTDANKFDFISDYFKIENNSIVWKKQSAGSEIIKPAETAVITRNTNILEEADFLTFQVKLTTSYTHTGFGTDNGNFFIYIGDGDQPAWTDVTSLIQPTQNTVLYNFIPVIATNSAKIRLGGDTQQFSGENIVTIFINRKASSTTYQFHGNEVTIPTNTSHIWIGDTQIALGTKTLGTAIPKKFKILFPANVRDIKVDIDYIRIWDSNVLPVTFGSFNGKNDGNNALLNWNTLSERNNSHFEIFRSDDGKAFRKLVEVPSKGDSQNQQYYSFTDRDIIGTKYYKLKQVDFDGKSEEFNKVVSVKPAINAPVLVCFYSDGLLNLSYLNSSESQKAKLNIVNAGGQTSIKEQSFPLNSGMNNFKIPVLLEKGIHIVSFNDGHKVTPVKIII